MRREAKAGGFWAHVAGTAYKMVVEHAVAGLRIDNYRTTLPFKKGLSSSAAVCVAVRAPLLGGLCAAHLASSSCQSTQEITLPPDDCATCLQVARAFNRAYGLQLSTRREMECAYQGERLTPSLCGRMVRYLAPWPISAVQSSLCGRIVRISPVACSPAFCTQRKPPCLLHAANLAAWPSVDPRSP